jgi:hypothetical protein
MEAFQWSIIVILIAVLIGQGSQIRQLWNQLEELEYDRRDAL